MQVAVLICTIGFIMIAQQTLSLVDCLPQKNGRMTLRSEPISYCFDTIWFQTFLPLGLASIAFYCGILVLINIQIDRNIEGLQVHTSLVFRALNGWYFKYRRMHPNWENLVLLRKFCLVAAVKLMALLPVRTCFLLIMILMLAYVAQKNSRPFTSVENNIRVVLPRFTVLCSAHSICFVYALAGSCQPPSQSE